MLASSVARASRSSIVPATRQAFRAAPALCLQTRQAHAISNPTLANIEKRWEDMPPQEQADLWMSLRDRMKTDWKELTLQEKKAGAYNSYSVSIRHYCSHAMLEEAECQLGQGRALRRRAEGLCAGPCQAQRPSTDT